MKSYGRHTCTICGKDVSNNGLATVNHMRRHVRAGEAREGWDYSGKFREFEAIKKTPGLALASSGGGGGFSSPDASLAQEGPNDKLSESGGDNPKI